ncbi:hypothetical protein Trco_003730 [Trichoderma cornu-damae]|uniref:Uncharacterized protein n=1 Tax=Trichoderma cornu-damae TaxID=654480 RepID=A0A9P8TWV0_9HYPO|nr:hypothetical protein Trco_003730 [Trichoderma cornu-damae]
MSLVGHHHHHHGGLKIRKARGVGPPGPALGQIDKDPKSKPASPASSRRQTLEQRTLGQVIDGILHSQRRHEAQARAAALGDDGSDAASLCSVATEKRALLGRKSKGVVGLEQAVGEGARAARHGRENMMPRPTFW